MARLYLFATLLSLLTVLDVVASSSAALSDGPVISTMAPGAIPPERMHPVKLDVQITSARSEDQGLAMPRLLSSALAPPPKPIAIGPPDESFTCTAILGPAILSWSRVTEADDYKVQVSSDELNFANPFRVVSTSTTDTTYTITEALDPNTTYYWHVKARNNEGTSDWTATWSFTPSCLMNPADGDTVLAPITLEWVSELTSVKVLVDDDSGLGSPVVDVFVQNDSAYTVAAPPLAAGQTYAWAVSFHPLFGPDLISATRSFTVAVPSPPTSTPTLAAPLDSALNVMQPITLQWVSHPEASTYDLQYYEAIDAKDTTTVAALADTFYVLNGLPQGTFYNWRVRAVNAGGPGPWAPPYTVETFMPAPDQAPTLTSPPPNAVSIPVSPTCIWEAVPRARRYHIQIATDIDFATLVVDTVRQSLATAYAPSTPLQESTIYYWRVRAENNDGLGPWPPLGIFKTQIAEPNHLSPIGGSNNHLTTLMLDWEPVLNADQYEVQLNNNVDFTGPVLIETSSPDDSVEVNGLNYARTYYWRVRAFNGPDSSAWSAPWDFFTQVDPDAPQIWPPHSAIDWVLEDTLNWEGEVIGCFSRLQFGVDPRFASTIHDRAQLLVSYPVSGLSPGVTHYWRILNDCVNQWSDTWYFTTAGDTLGRPVIMEEGIFRHLGSTLVIGTSWEPVASASFYKVEIAIADSVIYFNENVADISHTALISNEFGDPDGWRVQACNTTACGPWSGYGELIEPTPAGGGGPPGGPGGPVAPRLQDPANGEVLPSFPVTLAWFDVALADTYRVQVASNSLFIPANNVFVDTIVAAESLIVHISGANITTFYWRVRSCQGPNCGPWSGSRTFKVTTLNPPGLVFPSDQATKQPIPLTFEWGSVSNAQGYQMHVGLSGTCINGFPLPSPVAGVVTGTGTTMTTVGAPELQPGTWYCWSTRACNDAACDGVNDSEWARFQTFRTDVIPDVPTRTRPLDQDAISAPVVLDWDADVQADDYLVEVARDALMTNIVHQVAGLSVDSLAVNAPPLKQDTTYSWRVAACTGAGCSAWTTPPWSFTVGGSALTITPPVLDFGQVQVGIRDTLSFTIHHVGADSLLGTFTLPSQQTVFTFARGSTGQHHGRFVLGPGETHLVDVQFEPTAGAHNQTVTFTHNTGTDTLSLAGTGVTTPSVVTRYYYLADHLGSVRATVNESGTVIHHDDYYPFGAPMPGGRSGGGNGEEGEPTGKPRFTGHEREWRQDDAVYYAGARYYDAVIARWNAIDPLADDYPGISAYAYVRNNPMVLIDPSGMCPEGVGHAEVYKNDAGEQVLCYNEGNDEGAVVEAERIDTEGAFVQDDVFYFDTSTEGGQTALYGLLLNNPALSEQIIGSEQFSLGAQHIAMEASIHATQQAFLDHPYSQAFQMMLFGGPRIFNPRTSAVIGRQMTRWVIPQAEKLGAQYLKMPGIFQTRVHFSAFVNQAKIAGGYVYNVGWVVGNKYGGRRIIDVGVHPGTVLSLSPSYIMERAVAALPGGTLSPIVVPYYLEK